MFILTKEQLKKNYCGLKYRRLNQLLLNPSGLGVLLGLILARLAATSASVGTIMELSVVFANLSKFSFKLKQGELSNLE